MSPEGGREQPSRWRFAALALTAVAIGGGAFLLWHLRDALMFGFGAVVLAVLLVALSDLLRRILPLTHRWGVTAAALLIAGILAAFLLLMGAQIRAQVDVLMQRLPSGIEEIESRLGIPVIDAVLGQASAAAGIPAGETAQQEGESGQQEGSAAKGSGATGEAGAAQGGRAAPPAFGSRLWGLLASYGYPVVNAIFGAILVAITAVFLAMQPDTYRRGAVMLFPPAQHRRIDETLTYMGRALRYWLLGQLIAMAIVGTLVWLGAMAIGLPAPVALGLFAALAEFVPVVGPIVGAVPGVLLALTQGGTAVLWTVLLYLAIQQVESNMIAPLVQERMVRLPPALFLLAVVVFGGIFGMLGVIFAAPLAVVSYVAVQKLWVRDALHERTEVTGERPEG